MSEQLTLETLLRAKQDLELRCGKSVMPSSGFEYAFHPAAHAYFLNQLKKQSGIICTQDIGGDRPESIYGFPVVVDYKLKYGTVVFRPREQEKST